MGASRDGRLNRRLCLRAQVRSGRAGGGLLQFTAPCSVLLACNPRSLVRCVWPLSDAKTLLRIGYGLVPIVAGADKFTNLLVDWDRYLSPKVERRLPVDGRTFMRLVGVMEIGAGLLVLRRPRLGGALVAGWLAAI